jgi:hypothetical protein
MKAPERPPVPDALLLLSTGCPHCQAVLHGLGELVKTGAVGRLEVVNITVHPETARARGVRSVPWVQLGPFELEGLRSRAELRRWAETAGTREGMAEYFRELLAHGQLGKASAIITKDPAQLAALLPLVEDTDTALQVRLGIGAIMEDYEGRPALRRVVDQLEELTRHPDPRTRSDASHFLSLTRDPRAVPVLSALLEDPDPQVREVAAGSLAELKAHPGAQDPDGGEAPS